MASIHFYQDYLLPSTKYQIAIFEGNRQTWSNQRCTDVRVSVSVLPHFLMFIKDLFRCDPGEHLRKILSEPAFELYSGNGRGRPYNKNSYDAICEFAIKNNLCCLFGQIYDIILTFRLNLENFPENCNDGIMRDGKIYAMRDSKTPNSHQLIPA